MGPPRISVLPVPQCEWGVKREGGQSQATTLPVGPAEVLGGSLYLQSNWKVSAWNVPNAICQYRGTDYVTDILNVLSIQTPTPRLLFYVIWTGTNMKKSPNEYFLNLATRFFFLTNDTFLLGGGWGAKGGTDKRRFVSAKTKKKKARKKQRVIAPILLQSIPKCFPIFTHI